MVKLGKEGSGYIITSVISVSRVRSFRGLWSKHSTQVGVLIQASPISDCLRTALGVGQN